MLRQGSTHVGAAGEDVHDAGRESRAAHEIAQGLDRDTDGISLGDVADAINGLREIFDFLVENRSGIDSDVTPSGEVAE